MQTELDSREVSEITGNRRVGRNWYDEFVGTGRTVRPEACASLHRKMSAELSIRPAEWAASSSIVAGKHENLFPQELREGCSGPS